MVLNPSNSSNLEQLALKGLMLASFSSGHSTQSTVQLL